MLLFKIIILYLELSVLWAMLVGEMVSRDAPLAMERPEKFEER